MTAQQIADELDFYGSYFDVNIDRDYTYISFARSRSSLPRPSRLHAR